MYGFLGPPFLSIKSISSSQCLTSVYKAWSCLGARTISFPFDTQLITTLNVVFGNSGRLLLGFLLAHSPKSVAGRLLPHLPFFLASRILLAHFIKIFSTHCRRIHSALAKSSSCSQTSTVSKDLPPPSPSAGVHLEPVSSSSAPGSWTNASSP